MSIQELAAKGRYGDNNLLHVSNDELQGLNTLARTMMGRELTTNPDTGLKEAFLFAPLLAGGLGLGTMGTALAAGGLGAAEAALRGKEDPLKHGLMAGLTAGAGSALGGELANLGADAAAQGATTVGTEALASPIADASMQMGTGAGTSVDLMGGQMANMPNVGFNTMTNTATNTINPIASQMTPGATQIGMEGSLGAMPYGNMPDLSPTMPPGVGVQNTGQGIDFTADATGMMPNPNANLSTMDKMGRGMDRLMNEKGAMKQFMKDNQGPLTVGGVGIAGSAALDDAQAMREGEEAQDAERRAKYDSMVNRIKANYAAAGRDLPTNPYGPLFSGPRGFAEGGSISQSDLDDYMAGRGKYANPVTGYTASGEEIYANKPIGGDSPMSRAFSALFNPEFLMNGYAQPGTQVDAAQQALQMQQDPQFQAFKHELSKGAGNAAAAEATGYGKKEMAGGGYLAAGGIASLKGDGMSDSVPAQIDGSQEAALSDGEFVIPADVVSHLGNGSSNAGADQLYAMMDRIREARTGTEEQAPQVDPNKYMPA